MLDAGADIEATDGTGATPLFSAIGASDPHHLTLTELLISGADSGAFAESDGERVAPLRAAMLAPANRADAVAVLRRFGADPNATAGSGSSFTPLHIATLSPTFVGESLVSLTLVQALLDSSSDPQGRTVDLNAKTADSAGAVTALQLAIAPGGAAWSDPSVVIWLLQGGADANVEAAGGTTAPDLAIQYHGSFSVLAAVLASVGATQGSTRTTPVVQPPTPPPAPPPFQPQPIDVALGEEGGTITLMTTEAGGFTWNNEPFPSGSLVAAENGNAYLLTLVNGSWTAAYQALELMVTLGITEENVTLTRAEDGTYWLGDAAVQSGVTSVTATNGNIYTLTLATDDGGALLWFATYVEPVSSVLLGNSGTTVTIRKGEDGSYWIGDSNVRHGSTVTAGNGDSYRLSLSGGGWTAALVTP